MIPPCLPAQLEPRPGVDPIHPQTGAAAATTPRLLPAPSPHYTGLYGPLPPRRRALKTAVLLFWPTIRAAILGLLPAPALSFFRDGRGY